MEPLVLLVQTLHLFTNLVFVIDSLFILLILLGLVQSMIEILLIRRDALLQDGLLSIHLLSNVHPEVFIITVKRVQ